MITVRNLRKVYETRQGDKLVLDDVNFDLAMGEHLGILGRNGAGKSTMIRLISGAERPTSGQIRRDMSVSWPLAFGGAFQLALTGIDNIRFISRIYRQDFEQNLAFVEQFAELGPYLREPVRSYSSGMRARLAFAISMIIEFDCFLIDEIGAVGDARFHDRCNYELFDKRGDRAMIIISHDAAYVRDHCNRWAVLHDARLQLYDDFDEAYDAYGQLVGLERQDAAPTLRFAARADVLESLNGIALSDDWFRHLVQQGDFARDRQDLDAAIRHYGEALALHPYERSYWVQLGHMAREHGSLTLAEAAYRSAAALGVPVRDVREFLRDVLQRQGIEEADLPVRGLRNDANPLQPPALRDVELLCTLRHPRVHVPIERSLALMRRCSTLDDVLATVLLEPPQSVPAQDAINDPGEDERVTRELCLIAMPEFDYTDATERRERLEKQPDLLAALIQSGGFSDWPKAQDAFATLRMATTAS